MSFRVSCAEFNIILKTWSDIVSDHIKQKSKTKVQRPKVQNHMHKAMGMKVIDLRPPPACLKSYRLKFSLFTKKFIIFTNKAKLNKISNKIVY